MADVISIGRVRHALALSDQLGIDETRHTIIARIVADEQGRKEFKPWKTTP